MSREDIVSRLRGFVDENFLYMRPDFELRNEDSLMGKGIVDSMGVAEMIYFLEDEFGVVVADDDVTEENIGTINSIADYVVSHQAADERQGV